MRGEGVVIWGTRSAGSWWSLWTIWCRTKTLRWHRILNICAFSQISDSKWTPDHLVGPSIIWAPQLTCIQIRGQREFSIPGILDESQLHFFSLDHEKWFSEVSISSRNMRVTKWNLVLVSKYENGHMIISISSRQARARKIILNLVSKNCTFSREWKWDSKSKPITVLDRRKLYDMIFDK